MGCRKSMEIADGEGSLREIIKTMLDILMRG